MTHALVDRVLLPLILEHTGGNQHQAARVLGIARQTLRTKLRDLGLHGTHSVEASEDDPTLTTTRLGTVCPGPKLRFDAVGTDEPAGYAVR